MLTDDKVNYDLDLDDNINTRDQNRTMIVLFVLLGLFLASMVGLGMSHAPRESAEPTTGAISNAEQPVGGQPLASGEEAAEFSVRKPVAELELPGTIGKPQKWTYNGSGNSPAEGAAAEATNASTVTAAPAEPQKTTAGH